MTSTSPQTTRTIQGAPSNSPQTNYPTSFPASSAGPNTDFLDAFAVIAEGVNIMMCGSKFKDPLTTEECKRVLTVLYQMTTGQDGTSEEARVLIDGCDAEPFMKVVTQTANRINELEATNKELEHKLEEFRDLDLVFLKRCRQDEADECPPKKKFTPTNYSPPGPLSSSLIEWKNKLEETRRGVKKSRQDEADEYPPKKKFSPTNLSSLIE